MGFNLDDYDEVKVRIPKFLEDHPDGRIVTYLKSKQENFDKCRYRAELYRDAKDQAAGCALATGHATETAGEGGPTNEHAHEENCETSAIGRALANAGYSGDKRPSREEMEKVERGEAASPKKSSSVPKQQTDNHAKLESAIDNWLTNTTGEVTMDTFADKLEELTSFVGDKGKLVPGKRRLEDLSDKAAYTTYVKNKDDLGAGQDPFDFDEELPLGATKP